MYFYVSIEFVLLFNYISHEKHRFTSQISINQTHFTALSNNKRAKMAQEWQKWCRLCGKPEIVNTIEKTEAVTKLIFSVHKHFSISVSILFAL